MYSYAFVRTDIPLAAQIVQLGHACACAGHEYGEHGNLIVFGVSSEEKLLTAVAKAEQHGIRCFLFHESDWPKGYTAACTEPVTGDDRLHFRRYQLYK